MLFKENEDRDDQENRQRVFILIDGKKVSLGPELVKKYVFEKDDVCGLTCGKLYI